MTPGKSMWVKFSLRAGSTFCSREVSTFLLRPLRHPRLAPATQKVGHSERSGRLSRAMIARSTASPNPSVKGTSCGKPQAAPYLER